MALNLKSRRYNFTVRVMCLSFLLAFACTVVRVLLLVEGKCIASLQEDPAEDSLCLLGLLLFAPLQCKGLNLTSASVMGNWTASFAERLLLIYRWTPFPAMSGRDPPNRGPQPHQFRPLPFSRRWTPFPAMSGRDPPKRGPPPHQFRPLPFSRRWTPFPAVSGRDPPKRGAATWPQCSFHFGFNLLFSLAQGKCIASLQEDPAEDSLCLACFCCATTVQGLELDLRFCDGKLDCFFCWTASPYLTAGPLFQPWAAEILQKGGRRHISSDLYLFFQALDPLFQPWAAEILQKGRRNLASNVLPLGSSQCLCHT